MSETVTYKMGWFPDLPDHRDYLLGIAPEKVKAIDQALPPSADLQPNDTPILDQGQWNSCVAHAVDGAFMWLEKAESGTYTMGSRMFIYWEARALLHIRGDNGASVRAGVKAVANYGVPPEAEWPYTAEDLNTAPPQNVIADAKRDTATSYYRLNVPHATAADTLVAIKVALQKLPVCFGATVYNSIFHVGADGKIPLPQGPEQPAGGHALLIVGYDDSVQIGDATGALLIKNSWGPSWGMSGYGWLPYQYVLTGLATDFWVIAKESELDTTKFEISKPAEA